jgi:hypothetical protein
LPGQLAVETGRVLHRDRGPHLREQVAGRDALVVHREAGPNVRVDQVLDRRRAPRPPAISLTGAIEIAAPEDAIASASEGSKLRAVHDRDVSPSSPRPAAGAMPLRAPRAHGSAGRAPGPPPSPARRVELAAPGATHPNAIVVVGPGRSVEPADAFARPAAVRCARTGPQARVRMRPNAASASASSSPACPQSTTS